MRELAFTIFGLVGASFPPVVVITARAAMQDHSNLPHLFGEAAVLYVLELPVVVLVGGVAFWLARSFDLVRYWVAILAGAAIGAFVGLPTEGLGRSQSLQQVLLFGVAGGLSGLAFWLIWRRGVTVADKVEARARDA
jgi:hypothetical protein